MKQLLATKRPDSGRWDVEIDNVWRGEIRNEPDGLGYEYHESKESKWDWTSSFESALKLLAGKNWPS